MESFLNKGTHDVMWTDLMRNQIPSIREDILAIANCLKRQNVLMASKELVKNGWMNPDTFAQLCADVLSDVYSLDKIEKLNELDDRNWKKSSGSKEEKEK